MRLTLTMVDVDEENVEIILTTDEELGQNTLAEIQMSRVMEFLESSSTAQGGDEYDLDAELVTIH